MLYGTTCSLVQERITRKRKKESGIIFEQTKSQINDKIKSQLRLYAY